MTPTIPTFLGPVSLMTGIILVIIAGAFVILSAVLRLLARPVNLFHWSIFLIIAVGLLVVALLYGNIGVIYSHAGWTG